MSKTSKHRRHVRRAKERADKALELAVRYGQIDGAHHKAWVIDQMVRALTGMNYTAFIEEANKDENGWTVYAWDEGIAP